MQPTVDKELPLLNVAAEMNLWRAFCRLSVWSVRRGSETHHLFDPEAGSSAINRPTTDRNWVQI